MKNFTLLAFVCLLLSACAKEDIVPIVTGSTDGTTQLFVKVTYKDCYSDQNCGTDNYIPLDNAEVYLYENESASLEGKGALMQEITDDAGLVKFLELENTKYYLEVIGGTKGKKSQKITLEPGKTTRIQFKY